MRFIPRLESLRGVAALTVVVYHVHGQFSVTRVIGWFDWLAFKLLGATSNGTGAVVTFFVLSGFVLARSLDANSEFLRFLCNRIFRLFPAAMFVVALLAGLHWQFGFYVGYEASFDPLNVIMNLFLVRSDINGVMWSMTVECAATPLILFSAWMFVKQGEKPLWCLIVLLFALSSWGPYVHFLGGFTNLAPLYAFVVGVLVHFRGDVDATIGRRPVWAASIAIAVFCICGLRTQSALVLLLECMCAATIVALIAYRPMMALFKPLDFWLVRFYGRISYSFYLLHPLGISFAFRSLDLSSLGMPISLQVVCTTLGAILITTPGAYLAWRYIEVPAIRYGKSIGQQLKIMAAR